MVENRLEKDDYYEIEKILDLHAATISETIARYSHVAIQLSAIKHETPLDDIIVDLVHARNRLKQIRDKLQKMRLELDG